MNDISLEEIRNLSAEKALVILDEYIIAHPESDEAYTLRGLRHWALSHRAQAINDYLKAISLNPHSRAVQALEAARAILDFYHHDLYNP
ncbi:MAG: hypothetical protein HDS22_03295 [Bacteroides sp.]|nr:hypothetical protein [Bacteroides sp.]